MHAQRDLYGNTKRIAANYENVALLPVPKIDSFLRNEECSREAAYFLTNLASMQRTEIEPDVPQWFNSSKTIVQLASHTLNDAQMLHAASHVQVTVFVCP
jgi:hypothetical protein